MGYNHWSAEGTYNLPKPSKTLGKSPPSPNYSQDSFVTCALCHEMVPKGKVAQHFTSMRCQLTARERSRSYSLLPERLTCGSKMKAASQRAEDDSPQDRSFVRTPSFGLRRDRFFNEHSDDETEASQRETEIPGRKNMCMDVCYSKTNIASDNNICATPASTDRKRVTFCIPQLARDLPSSAEKSVTPLNSTHLKTHDQNPWENIDSVHFDGTYGRSFSIQMSQAVSTVFGRAGSTVLEYLSYA